MITFLIESEQMGKLLPPEQTEAIRQRVQKQATVSVGVLLSDHFRKRNLDRSGKWGAPSGYWGDVSQDVAVDSDNAAGGSLRIAHPGVALHYYGGIVLAKPGKAIAIPLRPENKGKWPSERFPTKGDAFILRRKASGKAFLATREDDGALRLQYLLVKSFRMKADPSVLPSESEQNTAAYDGATAALERFT